MLYDIGLKISYDYDQPANAGRHMLRVLFLCTRNSARSQMAEALMARKIQRLAPGRFEVGSAGATAVGYRLWQSDAGDYRLTPQGHGP